MEKWDSSRATEDNLTADDLLTISLYTLLFL